MSDMSNTYSKEIDKINLLLVKRIFEKLPGLVLQVVDFMQFNSFQTSLT